MEEYKVPLEQFSPELLFWIHGETKQQEYLRKEIRALHRRLREANRGAERNSLMNAMLRERNSEMAKVVVQAIAHLPNEPLVARMLLYTALDKQ